MYNHALRLLFSRPKTANKYDFGHVLIVGGSPGSVGAPLLTAMAALRIGAGLVTIATRPDVVDKLEKRVLEVMTLRIPLNATATADLQHFITAKKVNSLVCGPGLQPPTTDIISPLLQEVAIPTVLDASGLTCFAKSLDMLKEICQKNNAIIATPHDGEYKKLTNEILPTELPKRTDAAKSFAKNMHMTVVYKGHPTVVAHQNATIYQEDSGNPGLASAGTGDVLSGVIGGLLSQGLPPTEAADMGVHLHALAGDLAASAKTEPGIIASDIIEFLPQALQRTKNHLV